MTGLSELKAALDLFGISVDKLTTNLRSLPGYCRDWYTYRRLASASDIPIDRLYPVLGEAGQDAGATSGHYFLQDLWAARKILESSPEVHFDVGSRLDGFVAHVLVFCEVVMFDIRGIENKVDGLEFVRTDATKLAAVQEGAIDSLSSLHAAEHFGLGRYGDRIDPAGHRKFMKSLQRVLAPDGRLYFSVPVGRERVEFNAHRVLSPHSVLEQFGDLELVALDGIVDDELHRSVDPDRLAKQEYACGLFEFKR